MPKAEQQRIFLPVKDQLSDRINAKANELYQQLTSVDISNIAIEAQFRDYFIQHHLGRRLFFSMQNSTHILYQSLQLCKKPIEEISFIDYGAGLGTLFMLAGKLPFKKVVYNDYLPDWQVTASTLCESLKIRIDDYVTGDIDSVMEHAHRYRITYDIIASRNVVEHIYSLPHFYNCIYQHNPKAVTFSTTTANYHNPAMRLYHRHLHKKGEDNFYRQQRRDTIKNIQPAITEEQLALLTELTRGKAGADFTAVVQAFMKGQTIPQDRSLRTNTCDCATGVWNEHLLTKKEHEAIIKAAGFTMRYTPGYWDTHYRSALMNVAARMFNSMIGVLGNNGILLSPFVNIVAH